MFLSHICDNEQYYYPSYVNRFTKLGSVLRGWFKPLQILFGEFVEIEHNEQSNVNEFGYEMIEDQMPRPVVPMKIENQVEQDKFKI